MRKRIGLSQRWFAVLGAVLVLGGAPGRAEMMNAADSVNAVGIDLLKQPSVRGSALDGNTLLSPYSIEEAMALAYAGAGGATRAEMGRVLHLPGDDRLVGLAMSGLRTSLVDSAGLKGWAKAGSGVTWREANRLFGQADFPWKDSFLAELSGRYGAPLETLDFKASPEAARLRINGWVEDQTEGKIKDLIPPGSVDGHVRMVLANALYFKAPWQEPFDRRATRPGLFRRGWNGAVVASMMIRTAPMGYLHVPGHGEPGFTVVTLPYRDNAFQFAILLPDDPMGVNALVKRLTPALLKRCGVLGTVIDGKDTRVPVTLLLPKFRIAAPTLDLTESLQALGMSSAFDLPRGSADFSRAAAPGSADETRLALSEVLHKTYLSLDENGTEAAAAAAVGTVGAAIARTPAPTITVHVDHPFVFAIQHRATGACLFLGVVTDPRVGK